MSDNLLKVFVHTLKFEAKDIISIKLKSISNEILPTFTAGSHIDLYLPNGLIRNYSLCNNGDDDCYKVAVLNDKNSRGGSSFIHKNLNIGTQINISKPRNNFELNENSSHSVLIAGGIGITPLFAMAKRLKQLNKSFEVLYFSRSRQNMAFLSKIQKLTSNIYLHCDDEIKGIPDLQNLLSERIKINPKDSHYYCCGPVPLLDSFEKSCQNLSINNSHLERFKAVEIKESSESLKEFTVFLSKSQKTLKVSDGKSILDVLLESGIKIDSSCCEGICGTCETKVLEGIPDHRDSVLTAKEKASNKVMMLCVSGSKTSNLILDI